MPTTKELVSNKPLAGLELARIILADFTRMLAENGFLAGQTAYSRVAYDVRLTLHLGLPGMEFSEDHARSRSQATDAIAANPALAALEPEPPLPNAPGAILSATELTREIESPNLARIEHSLPIEVTVMAQDGHAREELIDYSPGDVGMRDDQFPQPEVRDVTAAVKKEMRL